MHTSKWKIIASSLWLWIDGKDFQSPLDIFGRCDESESGVERAIERSHTKTKRFNPLFWILESRLPPNYTNTTQHHPPLISDADNSNLR